jgi:hypothetical protein
MRRILIPLLAGALAAAAGCTSAQRSATRPASAPTTPGAAAPTGPDPLATATFAADPGPGGAVLTQRGDDGRTGWYRGETQLTAASVSGPRFGLRAQLPVDGKIYAQPLYLPALSVGGAAHDVVIVATEHDSVYAFDAHADRDNAAPLWHASLLAPGARPMEAATDRVADHRLCDSVVSSSGSTAGTGVVWTVDQSTGAATLRAFDAADISRRLWSGPLDNAAGFNHFEVPTVADGLVFAGGATHLEVYGLS